MSSEKVDLFSVVTTGECHTCHLAIHEVEVDFQDEATFTPTQEGLCRIRGPFVRMTFKPCGCVNAKATVTAPDGTLYIVEPPVLDIEVSQPPGHSVTLTPEYTEAPDETSSAGRRRISDEELDAHIRSAQAIGVTRSGLKKLLEADGLAVGSERLAQRWQRQRRLSPR